MTADRLSPFALRQLGESFTWGVATKGREQKLTGQALFRDDVLTLNQADGPPLAGKVEPGQTPDTFNLRLLGDDKAPALAFKK